MNNNLAHSTLIYLVLVNVAYKFSQEKTETKLNQAGEKNVH